MSRECARCSEDHLELARRSDTEENIRRNYVPDVVILTKYGEA